MTPKDPILPQAFQALRADDERHTPPFGPMWTAAEARALPTPRTVSWRGWAVAAVLALALGTAALWGWLAPPDPPAMALLGWRSPTDALLHPPVAGVDGLRVPAEPWSPSGSLSGSLSGWRPPTEALLFLE